MARAAVPMLVALLVGFIVATGSAILIAQAFGAPPVVLIALAPKSALRRDGNNVSARGDRALTAVLVIVTGIIVAVVVTRLMNAFGCVTFVRGASRSGLARMASAPRAHFKSIK